MRHLSRSLAWLCLALALGAPAARAGLFDDDEARKAILDLRQKLELSNEQHRARQAEQMAQMAGQMAQMAEQMTQVKRSLLDLNNQLETLRSENAKLRGQDEQLAREVAELQRKQKDVQLGVEDRIRKLEPVKVRLDEKEFLADPEEKRLHDDAMTLLRQGDFVSAAPALAAFLKRYPASGYGESVQYWLGNAQYGKREYREAIASFRTLVSNAPDHPKAPEALLSIANCQVELKDSKAARRTIGELVQAYPKSEAAQAGRERLASLK